MRPALFSALALSATCLALPARATTFDFTVSGTDTANHDYNYTFSLGEPTYSYPGLFLYYGVPLSANGETTAADLTLYKGFNNSGIDVASPFFQFLSVNPNGSAFLFGPDATGAPTISPGMYTGENDSNCRVTSALQRPRAFSTLALLDLTPPISTCASAVTVNVTVGSITVTPEPSTLALLGTGVLGVLGAIRRRLLA